MKDSKFPIIGYAKIPVRLMSGKKGGVDWHGGRAFWWGADCTADAETIEGGTIKLGGNMGGGYGFSVKESKKGDVTYYGEMHVNDLWEALRPVLESLTPEKLQEILDEYGQNGDKKNEPVEASVVEEEPEVLEVPDEIEANEPDPEPEDQEEEEKTSSTYLPDSKVEMIETNGWDQKFNLDEELPENDYEFLGLPYRKGYEKEERLPKIPVNLGCGMTYADTRYDEPTYYYTEINNDSYQKNVVELKIDSWVGISVGAIHNYGTLHYDLVTSRPQDDPKCSTSFGPNILSSNKIKLNRYATKNEVKRYPDNFDRSDVGKMCNGWYTDEKIREHAIKMFKEIFDKGWILILDNGERHVNE